MRSTVTIILLVLFIAVSAQLYNLYNERNRLSAQLVTINEEAERLEQENIDLNSDIEYFSDPKNLAKELKSKFNYKNPGEKLMIIVPEVGPE